MRKQLVVIAGPDQGRTFDLKDGTLVIGRGEKTDTKLKDPAVSRVHCNLKVNGKDVQLLDNGSTSGTLMAGKKIKEHTLKSGEVFQIGSTQLQYQAEAKAEATTVVVSGPSTPKPSAEKVGQLGELVGQTLSHYRIESILSRGQNGMVFKAHDTKEERPIAFKVLWPEFSKNDEEMQRFVRAMKTMMPMRHPNLVALYGAGKSSGYCWIAMEFVEGEDLTKVIQRIGTAGMLDWKNALRVAVHIARALVFADENQVIHRNIKPSNIMIQSSDKLTKLGDLMLAKALEGTMVEQITRPGELVGDIAYMSPERTRGAAGQVDGRSDIYSLGATVYALLAGRPPFEGNSLPETIQKIRSAEPAKPKKYQLAIPDMFEGAVLRMLEKRPDDRFQSTEALLTDLERVAKFQGMSF